MPLQLKVGGHIVLSLFVCPSVQTQYYLKESPTLTYNTVTSEWNAGASLCLVYYDSGIPFFFTSSLYYFLGEEVQAEGQGAGWGSYLHRWSGLV